ncbi:hypothetical protein CSAL01_00657 [Colletotrichum salicis]|uniref:Uncharacterized protein n=1 Tax=Colletotrichum salicis TaxID=1209931 RepID=A0A135V653_9PEZI|nr:hypothetical protein CSAL01_00657 [Colletotrichum salicis]
MWLILPLVLVNVAVFILHRRSRRRAYFCLFHLDEQQDPSREISIIGSALRRVEVGGGHRMADHLQVNESSYRGPSLSLLTLSWPSSPSSSSSDSDTPIIISTPTRRHAKSNVNEPAPNAAAAEDTASPAPTAASTGAASTPTKIEEPPKTGPLFISRMFMRDKALLSLDDENAECLYFVAEHLQRRNHGGPRAAARARTRADYSAVLMARALLRDSMMRSPPWLMVWPPVYEYAERGRMEMQPRREKPVKRVRFSIPR